MAFLGINIAITSGILAIIAGLLILLFPKLLRFGLGIYLIIAGILHFFNIGIKQLIVSKNLVKT